MRSLITDDDASMGEPDKNLLKLVVQSDTGLIMGFEFCKSGLTENDAFKEPSKSFTQGLFTLMRFL